VLALTESEAKVFWPVYNAYQGDMVSHYDRVLKLIDTYAKAYDTMTTRRPRRCSTRPWRSSAITSRCSIRTLPASERCSRQKGRAPVPGREQDPGLVNYELARDIPFVK